MQTQVWVNHRAESLNSLILRSLGIHELVERVQWVSPLARLDQKGYKEYRDARFLRELGIDDPAYPLKRFWPKGGPVWDALAKVSLADRKEAVVLLIEAKSYPKEVLGSGCKAVDDSDSRRLIEKSLDATAAWLHTTRSGAWLGNLYQSANRIAHVYYLRELLGIDGRLVNLCFDNDPRKPTTRDEWDKAHLSFRKSLGLESVSTPWLVDIVVPAAPKEELFRS